LQLTEKDWRSLFPKAPDAVIRAFAKQQHVLDKAGITATRTRLSYALANVEHECGGFSIPNLTENIKYTAKRMAEVWPKRFASAAAVEARFGTRPGWQLKAFDEIYGGRMGNSKKSGSTDGSRFIGRGGPQITGREGYREVGRRAGLDLESNPDLATVPDHQPAILAGFIEWKGLNAMADRGNFADYVKVWNGGHNGMADREGRLKGNDPIVSRLAVAVRSFSVLEALENILTATEPAN